jgi:hypothetical protein
VVTALHAQVRRRVDPLAGAVVTAAVGAVAQAALYLGAAEKFA